MTTTITTNVAGNIEINGEAYTREELHGLWNDRMGTGDVDAVGDEGMTEQQAARAAGLTVHMPISSTNPSLLVSDESGRVGIVADANGPCVAWIL